MDLDCCTISCVVIGINCAQTITICLESIKQIRYPMQPEIIYVDGGSTDNSVSFAKKIDGIKIIELNLINPTPGKGRNAGWRAVHGEWIHFFDSDVIVSEDWLKEAVKRIDNNTAAIFGWRKERFPNKNWFHLIADLEWERPVAEAKFFGGDVLIRRSALEEVGGYNDSLVDGEDPELSVRIRAKGWKIRGVDSLMCHHDINMANFRQYFRRAIRSGYGYAEASSLMLKNGERSWFLKTIKLLFKGILVLLLGILAIILKSYVVWIIALGVVFSPLIKTLNFKKNLNLNFSQALSYAFHCSIVWIPQFTGIIKYYFRGIGCGFRNII